MRDLDRLEEKSANDERSLNERLTMACWRVLAGIANKEEKVQHQELFKIQT